MRRFSAILSCVALIALTIVALPQRATADIQCPKGSLKDFAPAFVWERYKARSAPYLAQLHRALSTDLKAVLDARGIQNQLQAAAELGRTRAKIMERMFEQGFIAATDIVNARCITVPNTSPWNSEIKRKREAVWCSEWNTAFFCPKRR